MDNYDGEEKNRLGLEKKLDAMVNREMYSKIQNCTQRKKKEKSSGRNTLTGKEYKRVSMVKVLSDYSITGACHTPVDSRQGECR